MSVQIALIILRYKYPEKPRPFKVPFAIKKLPLIPCLGVGIILLMITQFKLAAYLIVIGAIAFGLFIYWAHRKSFRAQ